MVVFICHIQWKSRGKNRDDHSQPVACARERYKVYAGTKAGDRAVTEAGNKVNVERKSFGNEHNFLR